MGVKDKILADPILVGREQELDKLQHYLNSAISGKGTMVFVSGEAGSGKTRLTNGFLALAKQKGVRVLSGWCLSNVAVPYFPFVEAFDSFLAENETDKSMNLQQLSLKTWLIGSNQPADQAISPQVWTDQKFSEVTKELLLMSTDKPLILFIDDLHWADSASLALLHYVARSAQSERILILATFRSEEASTAQEGFASPLIDSLRLMGREELFNEIKLQNLDQVGVSRITESMLGGKVNAELVEKIAFESQGNPLFVIESLKMLFENGSLNRESDEWKLTVDKIKIPVKVKDIILRRLTTLNSSQRRILDLASIIGDKFDPQLLGSILNVDSLEVLETLNSVALSKSLVNVQGDYYKFDHAKTREVLYDEILLPLKKGYHERVAERIETLNVNSKQLSVSDLAHHYSQAGNTPKAIQYNIAAGQEALAKFSNVEAVKHFTYVLENLPRNSESLEKKITALEGLADALYANMKFKEAAKTYEILASIGGPTKLRALRKAMEAAFFQSDLTHMGELLKQADLTNSDDRLENARILMNRGRIFTLQGQQRPGILNRRKALQVFEEEYSLWDTAWCLISLGSNLPHAGELEEAAADLQRAVALFSELGDTRWLIEAYNMAGMTLGVVFGFSQEGMELIEKAIKINEDAKIGDYLRLCQSNIMEAWINSATGNLEGALAKSLKALDYSEKTESHWAKGMAYANLTILYTLMDDLNQAGQYFDKLNKLPPEVYLNAMVNAPIAAAVFLAGKNQMEKANQVFNSIFSLFKANPNPGLEASAKMSYAWALGKQERYEEAKKQVIEALAFQQEIAKKFEHAKVMASLMTPTKVATNQIFDVRLDLINVSKAQGALTSIEHIVLQEFKIISMSKDCFIQDNSIKFKENYLKPFEVSTVKLSVQALKAGAYEFDPEILYLNEAGEKKVAKTNLLKINVVANPLESSRNIAKTEPIKIEFESDTSRRAFDFLADAFFEDYKKHRLTYDRSGWRTLMDLIREGKVPKNRIYGKSGRQGTALTELERHGLIEIRVFEGERGRGGKIIKVRIAVEKENVRHWLDPKTT